MFGSMWVRYWVHKTFSCTLCMHFPPGLRGVLFVCACALFMQNSLSHPRSPDPCAACCSTHAHCPTCWEKLSYMSCMLFSIGTVCGGPFSRTSACLRMCNTCASLCPYYMQCTHTVSSCLHFCIMRVACPSPCVVADSWVTVPWESLFPQDSSLMKACTLGTKLGLSEIRSGSLQPKYVVHNSILTHMCRQESMREKGPAQAGFLHP